MRKLSGDLIISATLVVIGLAMAVRAVGYHTFGAGGRIAPGFMPFVAGLALAAFSVWAFAEVLVRGRRAGAAAPAQDRPRQPAATGADETAQVVAADAAATSAVSGDGHGAAEPAEPAKTKPERRATLVFAMTLGAVVLTAVTGFLVAFGLLILTLLWFVEREKPWLAILISVAAVLVSWLVFVQLLQVPLPGGMLGLLGRA
jgi:putative tricarboxylic transport membrane protein